MTDEERTQLLKRMRSQVSVHVEDATVIAEQQFDFASVLRIRFPIVIRMPWSGGTTSAEYHRRIAEIIDLINDRLGNAAELAAMAFDPNEEIEPRKGGDDGSD